MSTAHQRKKQPELVRRQLLEVAARLSRREGAGGVTLDAVSQAAGVSKGGLLHHFPNRMALLDGLFDHLTAKFDAAIAVEMEKDSVVRGRFTRAYVSLVFAQQDEDDAESWQVLTMALLSEPLLRARWRQWVSGQAAAFAETDSSTACQLARLTADGLWLADLIESHDIARQDRQAMQAHLHTLSLQ
ncbi:TetR/AcrR family transcriptional regulator [Rhizobium sp. Root482]|uniref:TetR/AcrR family transcriptional regulator n=1 Tax=Rhizobium sp. Root482 TaxID=1736543 RepID=UPI0006F935C6|nr:TetR/AcrR family transcriptional regulator [Rhizobium sp. Root482]KQY15263.1 TetR family transcriptional regulator [Rhizobium sp. Root482]